MAMRTHRQLALAAAAWLAVGSAGLQAQAPTPAPPASAAPPPAIPRFVEETDPAGLQIRFDGDAEYLVGGGVAAFDCDGDGLPELYLTGGVNSAKLYRNRSTRGGPLKLQESRSGLELTGAIGAYPLDIDGDGQADLVVLRVGEVQVFRGLGDCRFERANDRFNLHTGNAWHTAFSATWERGAALPTLAFGTYTDRTRPEFPWGSCTPALLYRPDASGQRYGEPLLLKPGHCALSMLFSDWSRSGRADLRVSNDREYYKGGQEQLWHVEPGQPPRAFTPAEGWRPLQIWGMGIASQDIDGDGYPELYLTSMSDNKLQQLAAGPQKPSYVDIAFKRGATAHRPYAGGDVHPSTGWHAQWEDVNLDGRPDLFVAKGNIGQMPDFAALDPNNLLLQQADGRFVEAGLQAGVASVRRGRGGLLVDLNADGLLDLVVVNRWDRAQLWRNLGGGSAQAPQAQGHWLQLRLQQAGPNRDAIGAWVEVDLGEAAGSARHLHRERLVGGGHASGALGWLHLGLGSAQRVRLRVQWPGTLPAGVPAGAGLADTAFGPWQEVAADGFYTLDRERGLQPWRPAP